MTVFRRCALPLLTACALSVAAGRGEPQGPAASPSPSPVPSPSPAPEELKVDLDLANHLAYDVSSQLPKWQLKQNNQFSPPAFKCIVRAYPDTVFAKVVLELVPADLVPAPDASPGPLPSPRAQLAPVRMIHNPDRLEVNLKRNQVDADGTYCIRVRLPGSSAPVAYSDRFLLELR